MKHLKIFENYLKHSDPKSVNNILNDFSKKLEDIIIALKDFDNLEKTRVQKYYETDGQITIIYSKTTPSLHYERILKIWLKIDLLENVHMNISIFPHWISKLEIKNSEEFSKFILNKIKKYCIDIRTDNSVNNMPYTITKKFVFPITKMNNIIKKIEEYYLVIAANKYNI